MKLRHVYGFQHGGGKEYNRETQTYVTPPGYDKVVELEIVEKGKHKGEIQVNVGRDPRPGYPKKLSYYSGHHFGKRRVNTGYVSFEELKKFVEECEIELETLDR